MSSLETSSPETSSSGEKPHGTNDKLVYMANQIGAFFKSQDASTASAQIAAHILKFWDPRMRRAIIAHLDAGGAGLQPATREAIEAIRART
jgi:formate dehydrogenase subunit delta